jgi:hypothetical protein
MRRIFASIGFFFVISLFVLPVAANEHDGRDGGNGVWNKKTCEDAGGVWSNSRGQKTCYLIQELDLDIPDVAWDDTDIDWDIVFRDRDLDEDQRDPDRRIIEVELERSATQRGNVGIRGTNDTLATVITCKMLGATNLFPPEICDWIAQGYDPDPFD